MAKLAALTLPLQMLMPFLISFGATHLHATAIHPTAPVCSIVDLCLAPSYKYVLCLLHIHAAQWRGSPSLLSPVLFLLTSHHQYMLWIAVLPGTLDPYKCTCSGEGLAQATAGQPTSFRIHTLDVHGNARTQGGDAFAVSAQLQGGTGQTSEGLQGMIEDLGQGIYRAAYTATAAGSYEVSVTSSDGRLHS